MTNPKPAPWQFRIIDKSGYIALILLGGFMELTAFFLGTIYLLDFWDIRSRDSIRAEHAKAIKAALQKYRDSHGAYPIFPNNNVGDLKSALVTPGYLHEMPNDPLPDRPYRYVSNGAAYGLWFHLGRTDRNVSSGTCITGVGTAGTGWWAQPPGCPFYGAGVLQKLIEPLP